jgi:hypothetical protein
MLTTPRVPRDGRPDLAAYLPGAGPLVPHRRHDATALRRRALRRYWRRQTPPVAAAALAALCTVALYAWAVVELGVP